MYRYIIIYKPAGKGLDEFGAELKKDAFSLVCGLASQVCLSDACLFDRLTGKSYFFRVSKDIGITRGCFDSKFKSIANNRTKHIIRLERQNFRDYIEHKLEIIRELREEVKTCDDEEHREQCCRAARFHIDIIDEVVADAAMSGMNIDVVLRGTHIDI